MMNPMARMRIAQVTLGLEIGGQERLLLEMARHADHTRFDWTVIALGPRGRLASELEDCGVRVLVLDSPSGLRPTLSWKLAHLFRREHFDAVHTHDDQPLIYAMPAAWWAGVPRRIHTHHHGWLPTITRRQGWLTRFASRFVERFVCVSHSSARYVIEQGVAALKVETIWNGIDLTRFAYQGPREDGPVVTVARLSPEKDIANLLHAAAIVVHACPEARFEIAGDGPCREDLVRMAQDLQLGKHVTFLGAVSDVPALLARTRLFVLPSQTEGISLTLLEAMARGLPVVATRVGGNPEVVAEGVTGLLAPAQDPQGLAQAILAVRSDPERGRNMGSAGRRRVETYFDIRKLMARYEAMYGEPAQLATDPASCRRASRPTEELSCTS